MNVVLHLRVPRQAPPDNLLTPLLNARALVNAGWCIAAWGELARYKRIRRSYLVTPEEATVVGRLDHVALLLGVCCDLTIQGRDDFAASPFRAGSKALDELTE